MRKKDWRSLIRTPADIEREARRLEREERDLDHAVQTLHDGLDHPDPRQRLRFAGAVIRYRQGMSRRK